VANPRIAAASRLPSPSASLAGFHPGKTSVLLPVAVSTSETSSLAPTSTLSAVWRSRISGMSEV
jgi:hypothetical protein